LRGHDATFESEPSVARVFDILQEADIVYFNAHAGLPSKPEFGVPENILQVGRPGQGTWKIDGLAAARFRQRVGAETIAPLVVATGCNVLASTPGILRIPEALGFKEHEPGRAIIGFPIVLNGRSADRYFRVFFALWADPGRDLSLEAARVAAAQYIRDWTDRHTNQDFRNQNHMSPPDARIAEQMIIQGDRSLRISDLARAAREPSARRQPGPGEGGCRWRTFTEGRRWFCDCLWAPPGHPSLRGSYGEDHPRAAAWCGGPPPGR
jgi:hypothetical protein